MTKKQRLQEALLSNIKRRKSNRLHAKLSRPIATPSSASNMIECFGAQEPGAQATDEHPSTKPITADVRYSMINTTKSNEN